MLVGSALILPVGRRGSLPTVVSAILAGASVVVLYIWDDVLLAGPVVATTALAGPVASFLLCGSVYALVSFVLAMSGVRAYDRWAHGAPSRFAQWLDRQRDARRATRAQRLLDSGKVVGFIVSSFLLGGIVTTFLIRYSGRTEGIARIAFLSSVIFAVTFTALYTGLAEAVFAL